MKKFLYTQKCNLIWIVYAICMFYFGLKLSIGIKTIEESLNGFYLTSFMVFLYCIQFMVEFSKIQFKKFKNKF